MVIADLPQVQPLSEDGGDNGGDPGVAILLIGGFGAKILLVVVPVGRNAIGACVSPNS